MMGATPRRFSIVRKKEIGNHKVAWLPVGKISLWEKDGKFSGKVQLNILDADLHVFEDKDDKEVFASREAAPPDPDDIPFPE